MRNEISMIAPVWAHHLDFSERERLNGEGPGGKTGAFNRANALKLWRLSVRPKHGIILMREHREIKAAAHRFTGRGHVVSE